MLDFSAKKPRKLYVTSPEKWYLGSKTSKEEYELSEAKYLEISQAGDNVAKMVECLENGRLFFYSSIYSLYMSASFRL